MQSNKPLNVIAFMAIVFLIASQSCMNFYQVRSSAKLPSTKDSVIQAYPNRYYILRTGDQFYTMNNVALSDDRKSLSCRLDSIPAEHTLQMINGRGGHLQYKRNQPENVVVNEVHIFTSPDKTAVAGSNYIIALDKISKIEVLEKNKGKTATSYVFGGLGITVAAVGIAVLIILATKSSCPFVSAYNNGDISLQGEIYGGAIYPQLARNDYIQLKMSPLADGNLQVRISNELKEKQFTDVAELMMVTHNKNTKVLVDEKGNFYSISNPVSPISATAQGKDVLSYIKQQNDSQLYAFDDTLKSIQSNTVQLTFDKPENAKKAKLVLRLKNSYWVDYIYGKMTEGFGSYYTSFIQQQRTKPVEDLKHWIKEQQLPLQVSLQQKDGWNNVSDITTFGPLATRETVIPLELNSVTGNTINVKLSTGFMFWELDYAAIDFSDDALLDITALPAVKATDETGKDVLPLINTADGNYLEQPVPGTATDIEYAYKVEADTNKTQTFVLHAKGYYEHVRSFTGSPNLVFLNQFKKADALSAYSKLMYKQAVANTAKTLASKN
jgi:hypothetical protein